MIPPGPATMMRIYLGDADRVHGGPAYHAIVEQLRTLSVDLPVVVEVVDTEERIRAVVPEIEGLIGDGMIVLVPVEVVAHRSDGDPAG